MAVSRFKPVFTRPREPWMQELSKEELVALLPKSMQYEIRRVEWAWRNIEKWSKSEVRIPATGQLVSELEFTKDEILMMFDPAREDNPELSEEDNLIKWANSDPVIWSRVYVSMNPRVYQILLLRDPHPRKVLRLGRRCGKTTTLALRMLFKSWTVPGNKSLLVAPMKSHLSVTWEMIDEAVARSPELTSEFIADGFRKVEQPHYLIKFTNGSTIKCFTSGVRSKSHADVLRGQEADDIYIDEVDLMSPDDFPAITSLVRDTGRQELGFDEKTMIVATTPNGRKDMLWRFCTELSIYEDKFGRGYKEYYFPTHADMNYSPADDYEQQKLLTHNQYVHEILADFGEEAAGVFLKSQIQRAIEHYGAPNKDVEGGYQYFKLDGTGPIFRRNEWDKIVVGVDWDKFGAGVNIVVCAWTPSLEFDLRNPDTGRLKVIARFEIPRSDTTLTDGVEKIKDIYAFFKPDWIYVDRGYGEMQLETLQLSEKKGDDPRVIGLTKRLRGIAFNEAVEIINPVSKLAEKKEIKDHMVTLSVRLFEQDRVILNEADEEEVPRCLSGLTKQFEQYVQIGVSITGKPRYEAADTTIGDHALDAFMLCALAVDQEWGAFSFPDTMIPPMTIEKSIMEIAGSVTMKPGEYAKTEGETLKGAAVLKRSNMYKSRLNLRNAGSTIKRTIMRGR